MKTGSVTRATSGEVIWRRVPWYAALIAPAVVVHLYVVSAASTMAVVRALAVSAALGLILVMAVAAVVPERSRAGVAATVLATVLVLVNAISACVIALVLVVIARLAAKRRTHESDRTWHVVDRIAQLAVAVLAVAVLIELVTSGGLARVASDVANEGPWHQAAPLGTARAGAPDIFILLLDGYPRADVLMEKTGFANRGFLGELGSLGFEVASGSRSSYILTGLTLASMLEMRHLNDIAEVRTAARSQDEFVRALRDVLEDPAGPRLLRSFGYEFVSISPGYEPSALRRADRFLDAAAPNEFELVALTMGGLGAAVETITPDLIDDAYRWRVQESLALTRDEIGRISRTPRFLLAHLPAPHPPFAYDSAGVKQGIDWASKPISRFSYADNRAEKTRALAEYLAWTNSVVLPIIKEAVDRHPDALVIVMSDHGTDIDFQWEEMDPARAEERIATLFAARTPGCRGLFGDAPTTVNLLPTLLNWLFDAHVPMAEGYSVLQRLDDPSHTVIIPATEGAP